MHTQATVNLVDGNLRHLPVTRNTYSAMTYMLPMYMQYLPSTYTPPVAYPPYTYQVPVNSPVYMQPMVFVQ